jgi:hypothetical protein
MPTIADSRLPAPTSPSEFEEICRDSFGERWSNPNFVRHGRQGQAQQGVDIYGCDSRGARIGIQCKNTIRSITRSIVDTEVANAEGFSPPIKTLYIATTCAADAGLQEHMRALSDTRIRQGKFGVEIVFWGEIVQDLSRRHALITKHYPQFFGVGVAKFCEAKPMSTFAPPQVSLLDQSGNPTQKLLIPFRRTRIQDPQLLPDFADPRGWLMRKLGGPLNRDYWRELAIHEMVLLSSAWIDLEIMNRSDIYLTECTAQIVVTTPDRRSAPAHNYMPEEPARYGDQRKWRRDYDAFLASQKSPPSDCQTKELSARNLRPGDRSGFSNGLLLYFGEHRNLNVHYKVLAKELIQPAEGTLIVTTDTTFDELNFEQLKAYARTDRLERVPRSVKERLATSP